MTRLIVYSRSYCHLCDDMIEALRRLRAGHDFELSVVDVDADEALVARYDELVPVLVGIRPDGVPQQLCHYFLDVEGVESFLRDDDSRRIPG